ncbi:MAG: GAF domain-containing protein [Anaerolineae bacterium]|nr:GAF domain-containing protein [Anaerolineae bacterium]
MNTSVDLFQAPVHDHPLSDAALVALGRRISPYLACPDHLYAEVDAIWREHIPADAFALLLLDATSQALSTAHARHGTAPPAAALAGDAVRTRQVVHALGVRASLAEPWAELAVPLIVGERCIGAIELVRDGAPFEPREVELAAALAEPIAPFLDHAVRWRALRAQVEMLEGEVAQANAEFVSIVAHELRTPLTSIKGYTDLVLLGAVGPVDDRQRHFLQIVQSNVDRLAALVSDLLDTTRLAAGKIRLEWKAIALLAVVHEVCDSLSEAIRARGLVLDVDIAPDLPAVWVDRQRVIQILTNLLSNACRYTPEGGRITVSAELSDGTVVVAVTDTGIGIAPEDQEKVFERFYRADHELVKQQPGIGLGLSIARSLVELHGGRLWLNSEPGMGSTFRFTLPTQGA